MSEDISCNFAGVSESPPIVDRPYSIPSSAFYFFPCAESSSAALPDLDQYTASRELKDLREAGRKSVTARLKRES